MTNTKKQSPSLAKKATEVTVKSISAEVSAERFKQLEKWGQQDHPSTFSETDRLAANKMADYWKTVNDKRVEDGTLAWDGILLEEVWEALAESDEALRRAELIQVAAVATAEVEAIDRRVAVRVSETLCAPSDEACGAGCESAEDCIEARSNAGGK